MRRLFLFLGLAVLALVWLGPLLDAWRDSFAAHMLAHMGVVAIAAPLLAIGIPFSPLAGRRWSEGPDEGRHKRPIFASRGGGRGGVFFSLLAKKRGRRTNQKRGRPRTHVPPLIRPFGAPSPRLRGEARGLPVLASLTELVVVWFWHAPSMRALAESSTVATVLEQASFLAAGLFLWSTCLADAWRGGTGRGAAGAFGLLLTSIHMTLLGALLALSPRPLYGIGEVTCFGTTLTAGQDQQVGGVLMLLIGAAVYLAGGIALLARLLNGEAPVARIGGKATR